MTNTSGYKSHTGKCPVWYTTLSASCGKNFRPWCDKNCTNILSMWYLKKKIFFRSRNRSLFEGSFILTENVQMNSIVCGTEKVPQRTPNFFAINICLIQVLIMCCKIKKLPAITVLLYFWKQKIMISNHRIL